MGGVGSGSSNKLSIEEHKARGTYRPGQHGDRVPPGRVVDLGLSRAARRRVMVGLSREGRRLATRVLNDYGDWTETSLRTLRSFCLSSARLKALEDAGAPSKALYDELRANVLLAKALDLT